MALATLALLEGIATRVVKLCTEATQCFAKRMSKALPNYYETCDHGKMLLTYVWLAEVQQLVGVWLVGCRG